MHNGLFARYRGKCLGTFDAIGRQSFHETKNIICGEGGAILLNDEQCARRAEILRDQGTDRKRFLRGQVGDRGILGVLHCSPLHLSKMGASFGGRPGQCPVAEWVSHRLIRLPMHNSMTKEEQMAVIDALRDFRC